MNKVRGITAVVLLAAVVWYPTREGLALEVSTQVAPPPSAASMSALAERVSMHSSVARKSPAHLPLALGNAQMEAGNPAAAERSYSEAVKLDPGLSLLHSALGASQHLQKKFGAASANYHKALELDSHNLSAQVGLAGIAAEHGNHREAIELFERTLQQAPDEPVALWGLAMSCKATNDSRTESILKKYLTVAPQSSRTEYARRYLAGR